MKLETARNLESSAAKRSPDSHLTPYVCWSRMQAEAGQGIETIVARKELERQAGKGLFFWGVGNAPATITSALARAGVSIQVVFSLMKSRPKAVDVAPTRLVAWRRFVDAHGAERTLPEHALVTSRADSDGGPKRVHYALMCYSETPLALVRGRSFDSKAFRNASGSGAPVGSSQVTALLRRIEDDGINPDYEINLSAQLAGSYWVRLTDPIELGPAKLARLDALSCPGRSTVPDWCDAVTDIRSGPSIFADEDILGRLI